MRHRFDSLKHKIIAAILVMISIFTINISPVFAENEPISVIDITSMPTKYQAGVGFVEGQTVVIGESDADKYQVKTLGMKEISGNTYGYAVLSPKAGYTFATGKNSVSCKNYAIMVVFSSRIDNNDNLTYCHNYYGNSVAIGDVVVTWEVSKFGIDAGQSDEKEDNKKEDNKKEEKETTAVVPKGDEPTDVNSGYTNTTKFCFIIILFSFWGLLAVKRKHVLRE